MATRTSFEIQPGLCRLVEVDDAPLGLRSAGVRVRRFITTIDVDPDPVAFSATLERVRRQHRLSRQAAVTLWGLRSTHQFLRVPAAAGIDVAAMAADHAKEEIALIEADGSRASLSVTLGGSRTIADGVDREVDVTAASEPQIARGIEPMTRAGFVVDRVLTPAMALASLARARLDGTPGTPSMYVALAAHATCIAVVTDGVLLMARELPWGHVGPLHPELGEGDESFDQRLASELRRSVLCFRHVFRAPVASIALCGDMTRLRRLTQPLGATLELPIETLDSLTGIDAESVPEPTGIFHADVAALRLVIAVGAERERYSSLIAPVRPSRRTIGPPVAMAVAAAVLVVIAGYMALRPSRSRPAPTLEAAPLDIRGSSAPPTQLQVPRSVDVERRPDDAEPELRVDSILFSPERRLAVVNGRIARAGDRISGSRIVDIQPRAVVVESPMRGRRTIEMQTPPPPSPPAPARLAPSSERR